MPQLTIVITPDESGGFTVRVPDLPGCVTHGDTLDQALVHAHDAIMLYLDGQSAERLSAAGVRAEVIERILAPPVAA